MGILYIHENKFLVTIQWVPQFFFLPILLKKPTKKESFDEKEIPVNK